MSPAAIGGQSCWFAKLQGQSKGWGALLVWSLEKVTNLMSSGHKVRARINGAVTVVLGS